MEKTGVQKLAKVLKILVVITFICNLLALPFVGFLAKSRIYEWAALGNAVDILNYDLDDGLAYLFAIDARRPDTLALTLFLLVCGICTAIILWQAKRVLNSILYERPFQLENADNMRRSAVCCFVISAAALLRLVWNVLYYSSVQTLFTYNTLFIPIFLMGGLVLLVMSALFRQSAEIKAENDMTI